MSSSTWSAVRVRDRHPAVRDFPLVNREHGESELAYLTRVVRLVEEVIIAGGTHLLVPREQADWLGDHPRVADYFATHHDVAEASAETGIVFRLRPEKHDQDSARASSRRSPAACTIIARNYLAQARTLAESFAKHEPGGRFYVLVIDGLPDGVEVGANVRVISPQELGIPDSDFKEMSFKYDARELSTAVKPSLLATLLSRYEEEIIYFDPDILIFKPLDELMEILPHADIVLIPHLLDPIPLDGYWPRDQDILMSGAYNLGFIALRKSRQTKQFLLWWEQRLRDGCISDPCQGLMTDQKWIDLVPGLFPGAFIFRDETYNVAYWNLTSRAIKKSQRLSQNRATVPGQWETLDVFSLQRIRSHVPLHVVQVRLSDPNRQRERARGSPQSVRRSPDGERLSDRQQMEVRLRQVQQWDWH